MFRIIPEIIKFLLEKNIGLKMKREQVYYEHKAIFDAVKKRDSDITYKAMKEHIQTLKKN